jgi:endonuclease/exonuclease/phosphatase family metal-dependent hydrolase
MAAVGAASAGVRLPPATTAGELGGSAEKLRELIRARTLAEPALYTRSWHTIAQLPAAPAIRVLQFNVLARGLSAGPYQTPPFSHALDGSAAAMSDWGGFTAITDVERVMDFQGLRRWRLLEETLRQDADLIALEEVDEYSSFFQPCLQLCGYESLWVPKHMSPSTFFGYHSDGVALFWRKSVLRQVAAPAAILQPSPAPHIIVALEHIASGKRLVATVTHLKAKSGAEFEQKRHQQIEAILNRIIGFAAGLTTSSGLLLLGDFNTDAMDVPEQTATVIPTCVRWQNNLLRSAYPLQTSLEPDLSSILPYSTWKRRGPRESKHTIDYVWHSAPHFQVLQLLGVPPLQEIEASTSRLPDARYPSDHLAIGATLALL